MKGELYRVGGCVRDDILGIKSNDTDYVLVNGSEKEMLSLGYSQVGKDFPVFLDPATGDEIALARTERKVTEGYNGFSVDTANVTLEEDLARRDLTINSMARDKNNIIIDPFEGQVDIAKKILRHTSDAFKEDPIRVLRLARFRTKLSLDWRVAPETKVLVQTMGAELLHMTPERVWKEVHKVLVMGNSYIFFETLQELGVLNIIFPRIYDMLTCKEGIKQHRESSVFEHTMMMLRLAVSAPTRVKLAILYHDINKPHCYRTYGCSAGHEAVTEDDIDMFIPKRLLEEVMLLVNNHVRIYKTSEMKDSTILKLIKKYKTKGLLISQFDLAYYDSTGRMRDADTSNKDIERDLITGIYDNINSFSPSKWIDEQVLIYGKVPNGEAIKQYIHKQQLSIINKERG